MTPSANLVLGIALAAVSACTRESVPAPRPEASFRLIVLEEKPDADVVRDAEHRAAISKTGLPWRVRDERSGIELLLIPPGTFTMGASDGDAEAWPYEFPAHGVTISKPLYMGRYEVTQAEWRKVMGADRAPERGDRRPADNVSWYRAREFGDRTGLRLPTEAEWEYACRAGTTGVFYGDADAISWHAENSGEKTHDVGRKLANGFGLHDMIGNVREWCADWHHWSDYDARVRGVTDPQGPKFGERKCERGGSALTATVFSRTSMRSFLQPDTESEAVGFRVCRAP